MEGFPRVNFRGNLPLFVPETLGGGVGIVYVSLRKDSLQQLPYINRLKDIDKEYSRAGQTVLVEVLGSVLDTHMVAHNHLLLLVPWCPLET